MNKRGVEMQGGRKGNSFKVLGRLLSYLFHYYRVRLIAVFICIMVTAAAAELTENDVRITSNNPAVVLVEGKTLKAAGVGMAKITVFADDESDSVNIRVKQSLKEITITNKSELRKILVNEERTVEFSVRPDAYDVENAKVEITSSNASVVSVNDKTAKAVGLGDATLTVKIGNISDSVDVSVVNMSNPTFGIGDGTVVKGLTGAPPVADKHTSQHK